MAENEEYIKNKIATIPLSATAKDSARTIIENFANLLLLQSKILASKRSNETVLTEHIKEAEQSIFRRDSKGWWREALKILGGALLGAFVPGIIIARTQNDTNSIVVYAVLGILGTIMIFTGIFL